MVHCRTRLIAGQRRDVLGEIWHARFALAVGRCFDLMRIVAQVPETSLEASLGIALTLRSWQQSYGGRAGGSANYSFGSSGIPPPYIRLSTREAITAKPGSCQCSTELHWSSPSCQSRYNYPYPSDLASKLPGPPHFHNRRALGRKTAVRLPTQDWTHYNRPRVKTTLTE